MLDCHYVLCKKDLGLNSRKKIQAVNTERMQASHSKLHLATQVPLVPYHLLLVTSGKSLIESVQIPSLELEVTCSSEVGIALVYIQRFQLLKESGAVNNYSGRM